MSPFLSLRLTERSLPVSSSGATLLNLQERSLWSGSGSIFALRITIKVFHGTNTHGTFFASQLSRSHSSYFSGRINAISVCLCFTSHTIKIFHESTLSPLVLWQPHKHTHTYSHCTCMYATGLLCKQIVLQTGQGNRTERRVLSPETLARLVARPKKPPL